MALYTHILLIVAVLILIYGLIHTYRIGQRQKDNGPFDTEVNKHVQEHPYTLNPVFITYIIAILLLIGYLISLYLNTGTGY